MWESFLKSWNAFWASFATGWPVAMQMVTDVASNPWARAFGLIGIVYLTIRVIAIVYSGDKQNAQLGPVAIRPHIAKKAGAGTVRLPHELMPMAMDGVAARCRVFYVYNDQRARRKKVLVHTIADARLSVSPVNLPRIKDIIFGQEIPDVETKYVCFPPVDIQEPEEPVPATPDRAVAYANLHKILDAWTEDDSAACISLAPDVKDQIEAAKVEFINDEIEKIKRAEKGFWSRRLAFKRLLQRRPNVVGSYYLKFEFSHEPFFVLTRHPDRDLKTTAWLTVLTSMFAMIMDAWPKAAPPPLMPVAGFERAPPETTAHVSRPVVSPP